MSDQNWQVWPLLAQMGIASDVVGVAVCQQNCLRHKSPLADGGNNFLRLKARVNHKAVASIPAKEDVAIFSKRCRFNADDASPVRQLQHIIVVHKNNERKKECVRSGQKRTSKKMELGFWLDTIDR